MHHVLSLFFAISCFAVLQPTVQAAPKVIKANKATKERLVLMPLRVPVEDKSLAGSMEIALVEGLQQKYEIFSGEQVAQKAKAIFLKESKNTAKKECDETRCMQDIAEAFQAELIATANVTKRPDGYFLALSVQNIFDNKVVYSKSMPCKNCDAYEVVEKLKELSGSAAPTAINATPEPAAPIISANPKDPEAVMWIEAQRGNTLDDYQVYLDSYPKGKYIPFAKARIKKINDAQEAKGPAMVRIPGKNYEMGKYEVTQKEWREVMGSNPSHFSNCGDTCPVERVRWDEIQIFLQKLNAKTGRQYRLPTEAEWEYACYGGSKTEYCGSDNVNSVAWYRSNSNDKSHPVGQKQANGYGLYDMSGNVSEWQSDCLGGNCTNRVLRGGSWSRPAIYVRAVYRDGYEGSPQLYSFGYGFRLARTLP